MANGSARTDGRRDDELRLVSIEPDFVRYPEGSVLISMGATKVLCAATVEERVPPFLKGRGSGWITAEYALLPRSTSDRTPRESTLGRIGGRTHEIQRLIGRSLRSVADLRAIGERTITVDCDVIQADGGTRTAAITGAFVALCLALVKLRNVEKLRGWPLTDWLAAVSVGFVAGRPMLDLCYDEDAAAEVDMNVAMTGDGRYVEVQGTAEGTPFSRTDLDRFLALAAKGVGELIEHAQRTLSPRGVPAFGKRPALARSAT